MRKVRLDHIGIAVADLDAGSAFWGILGLSHTGEDELVEDHGVKVRFLSTSGGDPPRLELLQPTGEDTPVGRFINRKGEGVQQLAFEVEDLDGLLQELSQAGITLIDDSPQFSFDDFPHFIDENPPLLVDEADP